MAHFAWIVNGMVQQVDVVANEILVDESGEENENLGREFLAGLYNAPKDQFVQCSYSASFRGIYPGVGSFYDEVADVFLPAVPDPVEVQDVSV